MCIKIFFCFSEQNIYFLNLKSKQRNALISSSRMWSEGDVWKKKIKKQQQIFLLQQWFQLSTYFWSSSSLAKNNATPFILFWPGASWFLPENTQGIALLWCCWYSLRDRKMGKILEQTIFFRNPSQNSNPEFQQFLKVRYKSRRIFEKNITRII